MLGSKLIHVSKRGHWQARPVIISAWVRPAKKIDTSAETYPAITHYNDVTMGSIASQITSLTIVYSAVYSGADQRKHQSSASQAIVRGIHRGPVNSPHKWPVTCKMFPFDDVIMIWDGTITSPTYRGSILRRRLCRYQHLTAGYRHKHVFMWISVWKKCNISPVL